MTLKLRVLIIFVALWPALTPAKSAKAQNPGNRLGTWLIYNGTLRFTDDWSVFTESHLRLWDVAYNVDEWLVRAAAQYNFTPNALVAIGYLYSQSYAFEGSEREQSENRLYEQLTLWQRWARAIFEHRYRLEQRWLKTDGTRYSNRMRYRLQVTVPLNRKVMEARVWFLNFFNEFFITFDDPRLFDQNRLYGAAGYQFTKLNNLQLGFLWQLRSDSQFMRLQIFYTHNFDFKKRFQSP